MHYVIHWIIATLAILVADYLLPSVDTTVVSALVLAIVLGILNVFLKPILVLLTLPINVLTLGLFSLVINAGLVLLAAQLVPNVMVGGFWSALLFSIIVSLVNMLFGRGNRA